jgi:hypothetical protein
MVTTMIFATTAKRAIANAPLKRMPSEITAKYFDHLVSSRSQRESTPWSSPVTKSRPDFTSI